MEIDLPGIYIDRIVPATVPSLTSTMQRRAARAMSPAKALVVYLLPFRV
jgi:hypothetical protein